MQSCSSRIVAKGSALYTNANWDLVDAALQDDFQWASLMDDDLPPEMRDMGETARIAYIDEKRKSRESIQSRIQEISEKREMFIRGEVEKKRAAAPDLGQAMRETIRGQAKAKGFDCKRC